jgi:hypothetical protein
LKVWANDSYGNLNYTSFSFYVDTTKPEAKVKSMRSGTKSSSKTNTLKVDVSDNRGLKNYTLEVYNSTSLWKRVSDTLSGTSETISKTFTDFVEGIYTWFVKVFDIAGNSFTTENQTFVVDLSYPNIEILDGTPENNSVKKDFVLNVSASDSGNVSLFIDDGSLVSWWRMDDVEGNKLIDYTGRNNGTIYGDAKQVDDGAFGKAMEFDGNGDYVITPNVIQDLSQESMTVNFWIYYPEIVTGNGFGEQQGIIGSFSDSTYNPSWYISLRNSEVHLRHLCNTDTTIRLNQEAGT